MENSIISVLAQLPREELEKLRTRAETDYRRIGVELEQLDAALAQQARRDGRGLGRGPGGETRQLVLKAVASFSEPSTPAQVVDAVKASGALVSKGAVRNMVQRLTKEGDLERVADGLYRLAGPRPPTDYGAAAEHGMPVPPARVRVSAFARPHQTSPNGDGRRGGDQEQGGEVVSRHGTG